MKKRKKIRSITAITWLLLLALLVTWLGSMICTTLVIAQEMYDDMYNFSDSYLNAFSPDRCDWETTDAQNQTTFSHLQWFNQASHYHHSSSQDWWDNPLLNDFLIPEQVAVTVTDEQGNTVIESGDYLFFESQSQQQWDNGENFDHNSKFYYISLVRDELYEPLYTLYEKNTDLHYAQGLMRITGYVDGSQITPVQIDYVSEKDLDAVYRQYYTDLGYTYTSATASSQYIPLVQLQTYFSWTTLLEQPATSNGSLTTVYTDNPHMTVYNSSSVRYQHTQYTSLLDVLHHAELLDSMYHNGEYTLSKLVRFERYQLKSAPNTAGNRQNLTVTCVYYAQPLIASVRSLHQLYLLTCQLMIIIGVYVLLVIRKRLTRPLQDACDAIVLDRYPYASESKRIWREPEFLQEILAEESLRRQAMQDKVTRLETALSYAKTAEENRRQMTSNIAHELKTPLAIIHSYTEGLKEHIAEEKRDQYLDTILVETERMDAMVMEMLDLSRLEAGKVTLSRTEFSLSELVRTQWETFLPLATEKQLQVFLKLNEDCILSADESRIEQVVRNFLSNAVRYTPVGGTIHIQTQYHYARRRQSFVFRVENSGHRFSNEELQKLWDTFYRADPSRSSKGTGLGLAICKNIISLHGGRCEAKNTERGVEFSFIL